MGKWMKIYNTIRPVPRIVSKIKLYKGHYLFYLNDGSVAMLSELNNVDCGFLYSLKDIGEVEKTKTLKAFKKVWRK